MKEISILIRCAALGMVLALVGAAAGPVDSKASGGGVFFDSGQRLDSRAGLDVALGDVDGDDDLDAFVVNYWDADMVFEPNTVWLNGGAGEFADSGQRLGSLPSRAVALGDLDGDGDLDAFVGNGLEQPDMVWFNDGGGTFVDSGQRLGAAHTTEVVLGDLDGDEDLDAFVASGSIFASVMPNTVWLNDGAGAFTDSGQRLGSHTSQGADLGDLDADGDLDAFVGNGYPGNHPNTVWLNDGSGGFSDSGQLLGSSMTNGVALGDLDGDDDLDAFVNNSGQANQVWLNDGYATFIDSGQTLGSASSGGVALGDVEEDGDLDAYVSNHEQPNKVWLNHGNGTFGDSGQNLGSARSVGAALGDVDRDGDLDAFVANNQQPDEVWLNGEPAPSPPPVVPETPTLMLLGGAAASLSAYVALQLRARRRGP